jgi:hypothetical protein
MQRVNYDTIIRKGKQITTYRWNTDQFNHFLIHPLLFNTENIPIITRAPEKKNRAKYADLRLEMNHGG